MRNIADVPSVKPVAVWSQSISGVSASNSLVAFYDIHGRKGEDQNLRTHSTGSGTLDLAFLEFWYNLVFQNSKIIPNNLFSLGIFTYGA
jgi:hypothetical protein